MKYILILIITLSCGVSYSQNQAPTPPKVRGNIDPCKLQTMGAQHAAWKAANCS
jgi:hypothetical protein